MYKSDANQQDIVAALRGAGVSVVSLAHVGAGVPDLLCSHRGKWILLEVKKPKGKLSPGQIEWHRLQQAPVFVVRTAEEALRAVGIGL